MTTSWYLKKADGAEYGPVVLSELQLWAKDGRVAPEDQLSLDRKDWIPAPELVALHMQCLIRFRSGMEYGPIHARALCDLILEGEVPLDEPVFDRSLNETRPAGLAALHALALDPHVAVAVPQEDTSAVRAECDRLKAELTEAKKAVVAGEAARNTERQAAERDLASLKARIADAERGHKQADDLKQELTGVRSRLAEVEGELEQARKQLEEARKVPAPVAAPVADERVESLTAELAAAQKALTSAKTEADRVQADLRAELDRALEARDAARDTAEDVDGAIERAVAEKSEELTARLQSEQERNQKREANLQQRVNQLEQELKGRLAERVREKQSDESRAGDGERDASESTQIPSVVRAALARARSSVLESTPHTPPSHAQRASLLRQAAPARAPVKPRKRRKRPMP